MKNLNKILTSLILSVALFGCGGDEGGGRSARTHGGNSREFRGQIDNSGVSSNSVAWGQIYEYNHQYSVPNFQERVEDFLNPQLDAEEIGSVSGDFGVTNTGIFFYGRGVRFSSQPQLDSNGYVRRTNIFNQNSSELRIEIEDNFNGQRGVIPIHFNENGSGPGGLTASLVDRNFIQLVFEDEFGKVSLEGIVQQFNNGEVLYQGDVWYRSLARLREGGQIENLNQSERFLGGFTVNACNFFDVQEILGYRCSN
jgi:hypothetical protein